MQPLSVEWTHREFPGDSSLVIENAAAFLRKVLPAYRRSGNAAQRTTTAGLHKEIQTYLQREINHQLKSVEPVIRTIRKQHAAAEKARELAVAHMTKLVQNLETQMQTYVALGEPKDWEPAQHPELPDLRLVVDERVDSGIYQAQPNRFRSVAPPVPPPRTSRPALRSTTRGLPSASAPGRSTSEPEDAGEPVEENGPPAPETHTASG